MSNYGFEHLTGIAKDRHAAMLAEAMKEQELRRMRAEAAEQAREQHGGQHGGEHHGGWEWLRDLVHGNFPHAGGHAPQHS